ncbi:MAG TPA: hypothetical protein VFG14_05315 [Chthoniobacteraceae bacterium]|jgi:hypothetical protein|nr:hypothetical protein [Chthoniobacteraceae bacterium]
MSNRYGFGGPDWLSNIQDQLSLKSQARQLEDMANVTPRFIRERANLASALSRSIQSDQLIPSHLSAFKASIGNDHIQDLIDRVLSPDLPRSASLADSLSIRNLLGASEYLGQIVPRNWNSLVSAKALSPAPEIASAAEAYAQSLKARHALPDLAQFIEPSKYLTQAAPKIWNSIFSAKALHAKPEVASAAEEYVQSLKARYALPDSAQFAERMVEQMTAQLQSILPTRYSSHVQQMLSGIDFDAIYSATREAAERIAHEVDEEPPTSLDDVPELIERADLNEVGEVVRKAVAAALEDAAKKGAFGKTWSFSDKLAIAGIILSIVSIIVTIVGTISSIFGQPIFTHWYEEQKKLEAAAKKHSQKAGTPMKQARARRHLLVSAKSIRLRLGPDTKQQVVATVPPGQLLMERRVKRSWTLVRFAAPKGDGSSVTGWTRTKDVQPVEAETQRIIFCALDAVPDADDCSDEQDTEE